MSKRSGSNRDRVPNGTKSALILETLSCGTLGKPLSLIWEFAANMLSRLCHYGAHTKSNNPRIAACKLDVTNIVVHSLICIPDVCHKPASLITPELLALKLKLFEAMQNTVRSVLRPRLLQLTPSSDP